MELPPSGRRYFSNLSAPDKLAVAQTALTALADEPEIAEAMAPRGYTKGGHLLVGRALLVAARASVGAQTGEVGSRLGATQDQDAALSAADALYGFLAESARVAYAADRASLVALGLTGEHGQSYAERTARMRAFVVEAQKDEREAVLAPAEVTDEALDALAISLDAAEEGLTAQNRQEGRSERSAEVREAAFGALVAWMVTMHGHARIKLRGQRALQQMLGIPRR